MTCSTVKIAGNEVIICGRIKLERCGQCGAIAGHLCDWKIDGGTCDEPMCEDHWHNVGKNRDLCWRHMNAWLQHPANKQRELSL